MGAVEAAQRQAEAGPAPASRPRALWLFAAGLAVAFVSANCGIGGGLFVVPLLHYAAGMELRNAVATSLAQVFATSTAATVTEGLERHSFLDLRAALVLSAGALL